MCDGNLGKGITRWSPGIFGEYLFNGKMRPRFFGNLNFTASTPEFLYTPVNLFSASHTHPDSVVAIIGEDFKFKEGNFIRYNIGFDFVVGKEVALYKLYDDNHDVIHNYVITGYEIIHRIVPIPQNSRVFIKISEKNDFKSTLGWVLFNRA